MKDLCRFRLFARPKRTKVREFVEQKAKYAQRFQFREPDQKRWSLTSTALHGAASTPEILRG